MGKTIIVSSNIITPERVINGYIEVTSDKITKVIQGDIQV